MQEIVSLDDFLNEPLAKVDGREREGFWDHYRPIRFIHAGFFDSMDDVIESTKELKQYNLMALAIEPEEDCRDVTLVDFEFLGYTLLDDFFSHSILINCGRLDKSFLSSELNGYSLLDDLARAYELKLYPDDDHSIVLVIGIWRHFKWGRFLFVFMRL